MIDLYRYFNKPEKLDMHFEYADLIDKIISSQLRYKNSFGPILHIIKRSPYHALQYARLILGRRWREVEPLMLKYPIYAYYYAYYVIKDRWPEAEPIIRTDAGWWESYTQNILK